MNEPTVENLNAWFEVLHRVSQLQFDDPLAVVEVPKPLKQDIRDCVERGWLMAWQPEAGQPSAKVRLMIKPEGRKFYREMCEQLASEGRPVDPCWVKDFG